MLELRDLMSSGIAKMDSIMNTFATAQQKDKLAISAAYALKAGDHELQEEEIAVSLIDGNNIDEYLLEGWQ